MALVNVWLAVVRPLRRGRAGLEVTGGRHHYWRVRREAGTCEGEGVSGGMRVCLLYLGLELEIDGVGRGAGVSMPSAPGSRGVLERSVVLERVSIFRLRRCR